MYMTLLHVDFENDWLFLDEISPHLYLHIYYVPLLTHIIAILWPPVF